LKKSNWICKCYNEMRCNTLRGYITTHVKVVERKLGAIIHVKIVHVCFFINIYIQNFKFIVKKCFFMQMCLQKLFYSNNLNP
jgi:hypothetical protein